MLATRCVFGFALSADSGGALLASRGSTDSQPGEEGAVVERTRSVRSALTGSLSLQLSATPQPSELSDSEEEDDEEQDDDDYCEPAEGVAPWCSCGCGRQTRVELHPSSCHCHKRAARRSSACSATASGSSSPIAIPTTTYYGNRAWARECAALQQKRAAYKLLAAQQAQQLMAQQAEPEPSASQ